MKLSKQKLREFGTKQLQVTKTQVIKASRVLGLANMAECPDEFEVEVRGAKLFVNDRYLWLFGGKARTPMQDAAA